uniref:hypothetical protein n=1 Tax=Candidatus Electrothrix sp. TaxID=2170559 RepID=UPI0040574C38
MPLNETQSSNTDKNAPSPQSINQEKNISRRTVLRKLAVGSAALAGCSVLPNKWTTPIIEFGSLPAHATTSGDLKEVLESVIADNTSEATPQQAEGKKVVAATAEAAPQATSAAGTGTFSLVFQQTVMPCASCGIWFNSARLVVKHSSGTFTSSQSGSLLIKKTRGSGSFYADMSSIPASATIHKATLIMSLNTHEGIANSDNQSVIKVYDKPSGNYVRTITAAHDIKGRGYSKSNPNVPIDFTNYAKQMHGK